VLIGHPERSSTTTMADLAEQVQLGAVLQINASSLVCGHGAEAQRMGLRIARSGFPFVIASDAHSRARPPLLSDAAGMLAASGFADAAIRDAVDIGPERILFGGLSQAQGAQLWRAASARRPSENPRLA
jgi:hypothetical protein